MKIEVGVEAERDTAHSALPRDAPLPPAPPPPRPRPPPNPHVMNAMMMVKNAATRMRRCLSTSGESHRSGRESRAPWTKEWPMKLTMKAPMAIWGGLRGGV